MAEHYDIYDTMMPQHATHTLSRFSAISSPDRQLSYGKDAPRSPDIGWSLNTAQKFRSGNALLEIHGQPLRILHTVFGG